MNRILNPRLPMAFLLAVAPLGALAQTTFFTDTFSSGSTTNMASVRGGAPTTSFTSYDIASTKTTIGYTTIAPNDLHLTLSAATSSGFLEAQAMFATNGHPVTLAAVGDYIEMTVVFTNTGGTILSGSSSLLWLGLYNSGGTPPVAGALANSGLTTASGSAYATGNCANWQGYVAQISNGGTSRTTTRPIQNGSLSDSADQELLGNNVGSGAFDNPGAAVLETVSPVAAVALTSGAVYTETLVLTLNAEGSLSISNYLYSGVGTNGTVVFSQGSDSAITNATYLTGAFDGLAVGVLSKTSPSVNPILDISSIVISGQSTAVTTPPSITSEPLPVSVVSGGSCEFSVGAVGVAVTYLWYRNNTALANGGEISGATSSTLVISPAGAGDAFSGANGYYCKVSGSGGYSTNTVTNSLVLIASTNLVWSGGGAVWDLNNTADWIDSHGNPQVFDYGDPVTFDDTGVANASVTLSGSYLASASVTINSSYNYSFSGSGSIAGTGPLIYAASPFLSINTANSYSGGTLISNLTSELHLYLQNYNGLGTGPVTFDNNPNPGDGGGKLEIVPAGGPTTGINGKINVLDDFTIQIDAPGTYAAVFLNDLSGAAGKTLTINPENSGETNRIRAYGVNTVFNANLVLDSVDSGISQAIYNGTVLAPYGATGSQTYNGVISGYGGIAQRGANSTFLNGQNTYSGGTFATAGGIAFGVDTVVDGSGNVLSGPIGTGPLFVNPEVGSANGSGTVLAANGARTIANPIQYPSATNNQTLIFGGTNALTMTGPCALNGQDSTTPAVNRTVQVSNTNSVTTLTGVVGDGGSGFGLIKTGAGVLALGNTETYTGPTMVQAGTLLVNGQLAVGSSVTVTNGTLGGSGTILGPVTFQGTNCTLAPGNLAIGTLTINNSLSLSGNVAIEVNKSTTPSNNMVVVTGTLANTGTGTVAVTNLGPALVAGDRFVLFSEPLGNGGALTITGAGMNWANHLAADGSITVLSVISTVNTNAFTLTNSYASGSLKLAWPLDHIGYRLQAQTNSLATGLTTNWVTVSNVGSLNPSQTNQVTIPISTTNPTVFFRLVYP